MSEPLMPPQRCACGRELPCFDHRPAVQTSEPQTEAGQTLDNLVAFHADGCKVRPDAYDGDLEYECSLRQRILAIESEARRLTMERLEAQILDVLGITDDTPSYYDREVGHIQGAIHAVLSREGAGE